MPPQNLVASPKSPANKSEALVITRVFDAPRSLVWKAWTQREHLVHWCAPHGYAVTHSEGALRNGGAWRSCMKSPEGAELWLGGVYHEIVENERLVMTHIWDEDDGRRGHETLVTITFSDTEKSKTLLDFRQENFKSAASQQGHEGGWTEAFERLNDYVKEISQGESNE